MNTNLWNEDEMKGTLSGLIVACLLGMGCGGAQSSTPGLESQALAFSPRTELTAGDGEASDATRKIDKASDQVLIKNGRMSLEVGSESEIAGVLARVESTADALDGYVSRRTDQLLVLRIPAERIDEAMSAIAGFADVKSRDLQVQDVTAQYVDLDVRIKNLRKLEDRLRQLLAQGQNVEELLEVEKELSRVTGELEALEGRMRVMKNRVTYAMLQVHVDESISPGPVGWVFYGLYSGVKWLFVWD